MPLVLVRMDCSTPEAALRYEHATADRDAVMARALSEFAKPADVVPIARNSARNSAAELRCQGPVAA